MKILLIFLFIFACALFTYISERKRLIAENEILQHALDTKMKLIQAQIEYIDILKESIAKSKFIGLAPEGILQGEETDDLTD